MNVGFEEFVGLMRLMFSKGLSKVKNLPRRGITFVVVSGSMLVVSLGETQPLRFHLSDAIPIIQSIPVMDNLNYFKFARNSTTSRISRFDMMYPIGGILDGKFSRLAMRATGTFSGSASEVLRTSSSGVSSERIPVTE